MNLSEALSGRTIETVVARDAKDFEDGLQMDGLELWFDDGSKLLLSGAHFYDERPSLLASHIGSDHDLDV